MVVKKLFLFIISVFTCLAFFQLTGCTHLHDNDDYFTSMAAAPENLHRIESLELEKAEEQTHLQLESEAPAPAELELSLAECRALVLENNLDLKVQLINPAIAAESVDAEEAKFEATFSANVNYNKTNTPMASRLNIEGNEYNQLRSNLGLTIPLRSGGTISANLVDSELETNSSDSIYNPSYEPDLSVSISQPLLKGAGRRSNEYSIRIAELDSQVTDAQTKLEVINSIVKTDKAYWQLYEAKKMLEVRKQQYDNANALYEETEAYVNVGSKARVELIRTRAAVAEKKKEIISAENNVRVYERALKQLLNKPGLNTASKTILVQTSEPDPVHYDIRQDRMVAKALENRMELLEQELNIAQNALDIDYYHNQILPYVSLDYSYNMNGFGADRDDAYDLLFDNSYHDHSVSLQVSIPLGNKEAKSRLRKALYQRTQRLMSQESKKEEITNDVLLQIDQLEANWQQVLACRESTILYEEKYRAEKREYELGMVTASDVLDAQTSFADARSSEISAITSYQISLIELANATGTLLGAANVQWEPLVPDE